MLFEAAGVQPCGLPVSGSLSLLQIMKRALAFSLFSLLPLLNCAAVLGAPDSGIPSNYKLLYEQSFDTPKALQDFKMTDVGAWKLSEGKGSQSLELFRQSKYEPKHRSPFNIALINRDDFGSFILEADLLQTGKDYGHRDMCVIYGFQDPDHFYYTHLATAADDHAHNIFIVNEAPRTKIAEKTTKGIDWGRGEWHHVRIVRDTEKGLIEVFFDDLSNPLMIAQDKTFQHGHIGFGSFDDTGKIDNIRIWGTAVKREPLLFFQSAK